MTNSIKFASRIVGGLTLGVAVALITYVRDERKFEPNLEEQVKAFQTKLYQDGTRVAEKIEAVKRDARITAKEKSTIQ